MRDAEGRLTDVKRGSFLRFLPFVAAGGEREDWIWALVRRGGPSFGEHGRQTRL